MRLFLAALLLSSTGPALAESLPCDQGIVWEDSNGNGRIDPGEKPLAGIKVSDGVRLVSTDAHGHYRLPFVEGGQVLAAEVGREDDQRVAEIHLPPLPIGQAPIVEYLKPAHTHFVDLVEPLPPVLPNHWELGLSDLGETTDLH